MQQPAWSGMLPGLDVDKPFTPVTQCAGTSLTIGIILGEVGIDYHFWEGRHRLLRASF